MILQFLRSRQRPAEPILARHETTLLDECSFYGLDALAQKIRGETCPLDLLLADRRLREMEQAAREEPAAYQRTLLVDVHTAQTSPLPREALEQPLLLTQEPKPTLQGTFEDFHTRLDAFSGGLLRDLADAGIQNLVIAGGSVAGCVVAEQRACVARVEHARGARNSVRVHSTGRGGSHPNPRGRYRRLPAHLHRRGGGHTRKAPRISSEKPGEAGPQEAFAGDALQKHGHLLPRLWAERLATAGAGAHPRSHLRSPARAAFHSTRRPPTPKVILSVVQSTLGLLLDFDCVFVPDAWLWPAPLEVPAAVQHAESDRIVAASLTSWRTARSTRLPADCARSATFRVVPERCDLLTSMPQVPPLRAPNPARDS